MVPRAIAVLDALPLTASGKIDKRALPKPSMLQREWEAPAIGVEQILAGIWEEVLRVPRVGRRDDFLRSAVIPC